MRRPEWRRQASVRSPAPRRQNRPGCSSDGPRFPPSPASPDHHGGVQPAPAVWKSPEAGRHPPRIPSSAFHQQRLRPSPAASRGWAGQCTRPSDRHNRTSREKLRRKPLPYTRPDLTWPSPSPSSGRRNAMALPAFCRRGQNTLCLESQPCSGRGIQGRRPRLQRSGPDHTASESPSWRRRPQRRPSSRRGRGLSCWSCLILPRFH